MKKIVAIFTITFCLLGTSVAFATSANNYEQTNKNSSLVEQVTQKDNETVNKLVDMKKNEEKSLEQYKIDYGSDSYGFAAYLLHKVQVYSIPYCFIGIALSAIYQYVIGVRKLDVRDKGFNVMIAVVTLFIIAQVLPLIFAIVVKGWGV